MDMYIEYQKGAKFASKDADVSDSPDAFEDCGRLIGSKEVVIDIDCLSRESIDKMLTILDIHTRTTYTDRGVHLYFSKPESLVRARNGVCALGIPIEMLTSKNRPKGITVKRNGVLRTTVNENTLEPLPWYFTDRKSYKNLVGMKEGDGRNNSLMSHRSKLGDREGWKNILTFINLAVFDEPLPPKEFDTICRDMEFSQNDATEEYQLATMVMEELKCVNYMGSIWWFDGEEYISDKKNAKLKQRVYRKCIGKKSTFIDEIVNQISYRSPIYEDFEEFAIRFDNGVLMPSGDFIEAEYGEFTPYHINIPYDPKTPPVAIVDDYIDQLTGGDEDYKKLLMEALGFTLVTSRERIRSLGRFFFFRGDGRNGKGTLLEIIRRILNPKNCTSLKPKQLTDHTYAISMVGKLANLGDDVSGDALDNNQMEVIKNISTCDTLSIRQMYKEGEDIIITAKLFFTTNSTIKTFEKGYAYQRRVQWLPMFNTVEHVDPRFITKITTHEALKYWIRLIMEGYQRLMTNGEWTRCEKVDAFTEQYHEENNPMIMFIKEHDAELDFYGKGLKEVRIMFEQWSDDEYKWNAKLFKSTLWTMERMGIGVKTMGKESKRVFMFSHETSQDISPK